MGFSEHDLFEHHSLQADDISWLPCQLGISIVSPKCIICSQKATSSINWLRKAISEDKHPINSDVNGVILTHAVCHDQSECAVTIHCLVRKEAEDRKMTVFTLYKKECDGCRANATNQSPVTTIQICSHCHFAKYCSKACQMAHWRTHKSACKRIQTYRASTS
jgi:hypothetical protein